MTPATLAASNWPTIARGRIHAPALPTCNDKAYDYFVTSADISDAVSGVVRINDGGCSPRWTSRLYVHGGARAKAVRRLVKPLAVPGTLPMGPLNKQHYDDSHGNRANFRDWYAKARDIWGSLLCTNRGSDTHQFRWEAATGKTACREAGASATSALLRAMTRKVEEAATLVQKGAEVDSPRVRNGLVHNVKACDKKQMRHPDVNITAVRAWCKQVDIALTNGDTSKIRQLTSTLNRKAEQLERNDCKDRQRQWQ